MKRSSRMLALVFGLALALAACGGDDEDTAAEDTATEATEDTAAEDTATEATATEMTEDTGAMESTESMEDTGTEMDTGTAAAGTIVEVASEAGDFTTLVAAVEAAGLAETLSGEGPFTVFAPTDEAFDAALEQLGVTADELLADPNLENILTYHVVEGEVPASDVMGLDGQEVTTVNGAPVTVSVDGDTVMVGDATVTQTDIQASNGIIHVIDAVLLPPES